MNDPSPSALAVSLFGLLAVSSSRPALAQPPSHQPGSRVVISRALEPLDGNHLRMFLTEVSFPPGASAPPHSHPCPVMVYVLEGALRTQVQGEAASIYRAGETFYEAANGVHEIAANASVEAPAKILAIAVCDRDTPRTVPVPPARRAKGTP